MSTRRRGDQRGPTILHRAPCPARVTHVRTRHWRGGGGTGHIDHSEVRARPPSPRACSMHLVNRFFVRTRREEGLDNWQMTTRCRPDQRCRTTLHRAPCPTRVTHVRTRHWRGGGGTGHIDHSEVRARPPSPRACSVHLVHRFLVRTRREEGLDHWQMTHRCRPDQRRPNILHRAPCPTRVTHERTRHRRGGSTGHIDKKRCVPVHPRRAHAARTMSTDSLFAQAARRTSTTGKCPPDDAKISGVRSSYTAHRARHASHTCARDIGAAAAAPVTSTTGRCVPVHPRRAHAACTLSTDSLFAPAARRASTTGK